MIRGLKSFIQYLIQKTLGYSSYLYIFSIYRVYKYRLFRDDADFNCFLELTKSTIPSTIIDAGANVGYTSVIFSKEHPSFNIVSYEPVSLLSNIIFRVIDFFKIRNIQVKQLALGNFKSVVTIKTPIIDGVKKQGLSFINFQVERDDTNQMFDFLEEQVQMVSISEDLLDKNILPIIGIKIDVENFEFFVLQGATSLIKQYMPVVMAELWDNERKSNCIKLMNELGYEVKIVINNKLVDYTNQKALNYFFIPKSR